MLLQLRRDVSSPSLERVLKLASDLGYRPHFLDPERTLLQLDQDVDLVRERFGDRSMFEDLEAVKSVLDSRDAPERVLRRADGGETVVQIGQAVFGGGRAALIAGPCSIEDEERLIEIAYSVREAGATMLRGGAYKPRTSPYSFQGLGVAGLEMLKAARAETGLGIVTEVLDPRDVEAVAEAADLLQIGSRNMCNSALLKEVGKAGKPVLLKRGLAAKVREYVLAAEYILAEGNDQVILCERGVRGFDSVTRNVLDVGAIAWLKRETHLPVIADPSHAAGHADLVAPLARAGLAAGADGLIVEVHPVPYELRSDAEQALLPASFAKLAREAQRVLAIDGRTLACFDDSRENQRV
ncbi:MAG: 3-deoxy-7-phosphoheptulonate synthase [Planctomycetota bacterium]|jgi:3-deoxy-7-phosphoheptulonate synthase